MVFIASTQATMKKCKRITGIPFNMPGKWNCAEIIEQNFTFAQVIICTPTHVCIPAIKSIKSNITQTVCTSQDDHYLQFLIGS